MQTTKRTIITLDEGDEIEVRIKGGPSIIVEGIGYASEPQRIGLHITTPEETNIKTNRCKVSKDEDLEETGVGDFDIEMVDGFAAVIF